jgi:hypothetical protein
MNTKKLIVPLMLALGCGAVHAAALPFLGAAQQFAVLGAGAVTNTGPTALHGDLGAAPGAALSGGASVAFAAGGNIHRGDAVAATAVTDTRAAYDRLVGMTAGVDLSGQDLGSVGTLTAGVYRLTSSAVLTGAMTIDFANDPNGIIVFQIGSSLVTAANSMINVINGTSSNGIYFQVGSSAILGADAVFAGNLLAMDSVTFGAASTMACGRALALGAVTMLSNTISNDCAANSPGNLANDYGSNGYSGFGVAALPPVDVPEPVTLGLFGLGLCALGALRGGLRGGLRNNRPSAGV